MSRFGVLHVIEAMHRGGAESLIAEHARHAAPDVRTIVCALNRGGPALELARRAGAETFVLGGGTRRLARLIQLAERIRAGQVALVNGHNPVGGLYGTLAARLAGVPAIRTEHSVPYPGRGSRGYALVEPLLVRLSARVIGVCDTVRDRHAARHPGESRRFVAIANGVSDVAAPPSRPAARAALGIADEPLVLAIGSLTPQKDHATLLEAFTRASAAAPQARLAVAGEGPLGPALHERARSLGIAPRVLWLGDRDDTPGLLAAADVFALSSRREGLPLTLLEAMRGARAAVATDAGGTREALADGETGWLVPPADPVALGDALARLLAQPAEREAMGRRARERWARHFTADRMVRATEALYRAVLGRAPVAGPAADEPAGVPS